MPQRTRSPSKQRGWALCSVRNLEPGHRGRTLPTLGVGWTSPDQGAYFISNVTAAELTLGHRWSGELATYKHHAPSSLYIDMNYSERRAVLREHGRAFFEQPCYFLLARTLCGYKPVR